MILIKFILANAVGVEFFLPLFPKAYANASSK